MRHHARLWMCLSLLGPNAVWASAPTQPAPESQRTPAETAAAYATELAATYAHGPFAERINLSLERPGERRSLGTASLIRTAETDPALILHLGPLTFLLSPGEINALHRSNDAIYWRSSADGWRALTTSIPEVPLPQLMWIIHPPDSPGPLRWGPRTDFITQVRWENAEPLPPERAGEPRRVKIIGRSGGRAVHALIRHEGDARWRLEEWRMPASSQADWTLKVAATPLSPLEITSSGTFSTAGRTAVQSLSNLRAPSVALMPGAPIPDLALVTSSMQGWDPAQAIPSTTDGPLNAPLSTHTDTFALLILALNTPESQAAAEELRQAFGEGRDRLDRARRQGRTTLPRYFIRCAVVLEPSECFDRSGVRLRELAPPLPTTDPSAVPLFTCGGSRLLELLAPKASVIVVGVDAGSVVRFLAAPDPASPRASAIAREWAGLILGPADASLLDQE